MTQMNRTLVIDIVGLTEPMLGEDTPNLNKLINSGDIAKIDTINPAVTCSVQSSFLTGDLPTKHGIVANGWYDRDYNEVWLWRQSNRLVESEKIWETGKRLNPSFTCANMFWWYNMATTVDYSVTPRPMYTADGRKIPDCHSHPIELRDFLTEKLGPFPLFKFWGPNTSIDSSRWIADASKLVWKEKLPTLMLVYLPHLDYNLQRLGPHHPTIRDDLRLVDQLCGELIETAIKDNAKTLILSEYAVTPVENPIYINQVLRKYGFVKIRDELGLDQIDLSNSNAFAVCDHQIAHIYVKDRDQVAAVTKILHSIDGIAQLLVSEEDKASFGLAHKRSGDIIALAKPDAWFTYYFWLNNKQAPDYARTVDIHKKPGYDPVELFIDPNISFPTITIGWKLLKKKIGFRQLLDIIPLKPDLVKGSHGLAHSSGGLKPAIISSEKACFNNTNVPACSVKSIILEHICANQ